MRESYEMYHVESGDSSPWVESHETKNHGVDTHYWSKTYEKKNEIQNSGRSVYPSFWIESYDESRESLENKLNRSEQLQKAIGVWMEPAMSLARSLWLTKDFADAWKKKIEGMRQDKKYQWLSSKWQEIQAFYETLEGFGYKNVIKPNTPISEEVWRDLIGYLKELWEQKNAWAEMASFMDKFWDKRDELEKSSVDGTTFFGMKLVDRETEIEKSYRSGSFLNRNDNNYNVA